MKKSDKKIEKAIISQLTDVCEETLKTDIGFEWLTHTVNYNRFPASLKVICVFDRKHHLAKALGDGTDKILMENIKRKLASIDIKLANAKKQIFFDCEEDCQNQHQGNWEKRLISQH